MLRVVCRLGLGRRSSGGAGWRNYSVAAKDVYDKYKEKLEKKAKEVGAKDIDQLKEKLKSEIEAKKKSFNSGQVDLLKELEKHTAASGAGKLDNRATIKINSPLKPISDKPPFKTLNSYIDVEKVRALGEKEISVIWRARFKPDQLCSIVPITVFDRLAVNAKKYPSFIIPLKREGQGHELHFVQWNFTGTDTVHVIFTTLAEYKLHGEFSNPHMTLTFHTELSDKNLVLMNGDNSGDLNSAQLLILNLQNFYGGLGDTPAVKLLQAFNQGLTEFSLEKLIEESDKLQ